MSGHDEVGRGKAFVPIPDDPSAAQVRDTFDADETWVLTANGDYQSAAVQAIHFESGAVQELIALEWPGRFNHTHEPTTVRLMIDPEDALGLADVLVHSAKWLLSRDEMRKRGLT